MAQHQQDTAFLPDELDRRCGGRPFCPNSSPSCRLSPPRRKRGGRYKNRNIHRKQLLATVKNGEAQVLTKEKLRERIAAPKKTPAPMVAEGSTYQTYIKSLLHETLTEREKRKGCDRPDSSNDGAKSGSVDRPP